MALNGHKPVVVAMSGGVDSSTAAALLAESGAPVIGLTMQLWDQRRLNNPAAEAAGLNRLAGAARASRFSPGASAPGLEVVHSGRCCSLDDAYDARRVAAFLGFPFYVVNFEQKFEETVIRRFVASYLAGETPIPCTLCNNYIKFDHLLTTARQIGAERLATGHYARVRFNPDTGRYELLRAVDQAKDQSYFLFGLTQEQLAATLFPLGDYTKVQVRQLARQRQLPVAEKPESQEICFVPTGKYIGFLEAYVAEQGRELSTRPGEIVSTDGRVLGTHAGLHRFTIGQRRGLGVAATGKPLYVVALDRATNRVILGEDRELYRAAATVSDVNWVSIAPPSQPLRVQIKIRNKHEMAPATLYPMGSGQELALAGTGFSPYVSAEKRKKALAPEAFHDGRPPALRAGNEASLPARPSEAAVAGNGGAEAPPRQVKEPEVESPARTPGGLVRIEFDEPQRAITPGQAAVFYQDDLVLGGGWLK